MKINTKILCIPPYVSVTWDQVLALESEPDEKSSSLVLVLHLADGKLIRIPHLDSSIIDIIFQSHLKYLEENSQIAMRRMEGEQMKSPAGLLQQIMGLTSEQMGGLPIRFGITGPTGLENMEMVMQHNQAQANASDLPKEVLEKIASIAKMMLGPEAAHFPKPEAHCNCPHCQVARFFHGIEREETNETVEENVTEEDLKFRDWDIVQCGNKLYSVTNPLDQKETYNVYLGTPIGCTCGQQHCEHIKAVLSS